jgi:4-hydroxythreonine-4-phosphate dehydrogenase
VASLNARSKSPIAPIALTPIVLTMGDPAGIGPEIACLAWERLRATGPAFFVVAAPDALGAAATSFKRAFPLALIEDPAECAAAFGEALPVLALGPEYEPLELRKPDPANASAVAASIETAVGLALEGRARAVVTNPIAKSVMHDGGFAYPGHTELIGHLARDAAHPEPPGPVMMLVGGGIRVALATIHVPLTEVASVLSVERIVRVTRVLDAALRRDFGIARPRIALAGLNPHAGEGGDIGREEIEVINPAAARLRDQHGIDVTDARSGDALFAPHEREGYDAVVAMYHDQGLIPVKTLDFDGGVNVTLGLPIVRTSPDHGTAFAIAGKGVARPESLLSAIALADAIAERRARVPA